MIGAQALVASLTGAGVDVCFISLRSSRDIRRNLVIGAQALVASLTGARVDVCFMNPGTYATVLRRHRRR